MLRHTGNPRFPFTLEHHGQGKQHTVMLADPYNSRVKLIRHQGDPAIAASALYNAAKSFDFGKAIAFVTEKNRAGFSRLFREEGRIPGYFSGKDAYCMAAYANLRRSIPHDRQKANEILKGAQNKKVNHRQKSPFPIRRATMADIKTLAAFYGTIFQKSYPTPVSDPEYLRKVITGSSVFVLMEDREQLCGAASLEVDVNNRSAEVTDCAVLPDYRGLGALQALVNSLEEEARRLELISLYSLSRALLPGINMVLATAGYRWYGRMVNNCRICGGFEDMNIWQKFL